MMWASTQAYADFAAQMQILLGKRQFDEQYYIDARDTITSVILGGVLIAEASAVPAPKAARKPKRR
jgi:TetR/AcrR family transcriptional regulator